MEYFVGKWQDHKILVENSDSEKLTLDGEVVMQTKPGIRFASVLTAEIPGTNGLSVYVMLNGTHSCYCVVGKPLKVEYDKSTKKFSAEYNGHTIEAMNKLKARMYIDGEEIDKEGEGLRNFVILGSPADESGKRFMAIVDGATSGLSLRPKCDIYAEAENVRMVRCEKVGGELIPAQGSDVDAAFVAGFVIGDGT